MGATDGTDVTVQTGGVYYEAAAFTDKETYYLSATAGAFTTTASGVKLGIANGTGQLMLNIIQDDRDVVGTIKPWLQNHAGMIANPLTAFWKLCDGTVINDAESPLNFAGAGEVPDLNSTPRFLRGAATSDAGTDNTAAGSDTSGGTTTGGASRTCATLDSSCATGGHQHSFSSPNIPAYISVVFIMKIK